MKVVDYFSPTCSSSSITSTSYTLLDVCISNFTGLGGSSFFKTCPPSSLSSLTYSDLHCTQLANSSDIPLDTCVDNYGASTSTSLSSSPSAPSGLSGNAGKVSYYPSCTDQFSPYAITYFNNECIDLTLLSNYSDSALISCNSSSISFTTFDGNTDCSSSATFVSSVPLYTIGCQGGVAAQCIGIFSIIFFVVVYFFFYSFFLFFCYRF